MVDVGDKTETERTATAEGRVWLPAHVHALVASHAAAKGDVLTVAQLAGIMGAKWTATLIPLCHPVALTSIAVDLRLRPADLGDAAGSGVVVVQATARCRGRTGVEMEALTAVAVAALTVYDMVKAAAHTVVIRDIRLVHKDGGRAPFHADPVQPPSS
jgi:cyclic pyranopterin monophosphate synthase